MAETISRSNAPTRRRSTIKLAEHDQSLEKDETELRLEKALFGDDAGFLESLTARDSVPEKSLLWRHASDDHMSIGGQAEPEEDLEEVPDEDLFFLDAGTGDLPAAVRKDLENSESRENIQRRQPVWYDSDDDRISVSLASNTRLRKLRDTADDDIVTGREYIARLRRQYERLHPTPEWVTYARKKRRTFDGAQDSASELEADSDISMSDSESTRSVQPLASLLRTAGSLTKSSSNNTIPGKRRKLRSEVIDISKVTSVTASGPSSIDTLQFHPHYPLLLASGPSSTASLYHISPHPPNPNPLLTSLHLKGTPLHHVEFCTPTQTPSEEGEKDLTRIFLSGRRRYFHIWSLSSGTVTKVSRPLKSFKHSQKTTERFKISPSGKYIGLISSSRAGGGTINILDSNTLSWICSCRVDSQGGIADFDWWGHPSASREGEEADEGFAVIGKSGEVSEYSLSSGRVLARWHDEGAVGSTVLCISPDGRWIAVGSSSGIVNVYDRHAPGFKEILSPTSSSNQTIADPARPKPARTLDNLTTPISHLAVSIDSQMLVMASRWKKSALRLVHLPSCTVYKNWPTDKTNLGRVSAVAVSPDGGYLAVGNEKGAVRLWEIRD